MSFHGTLNKVIRGHNGWLKLIQSWRCLLRRLHKALHSDLSASIFGSFFRCLTLIWDDLHQIFSGSQSSLLLLLLFHYKHFLHGISCWRFAPKIILHETLDLHDALRFQAIYVVLVWMNCWINLLCSNFHVLGRINLVVHLFQRAEIYSFLMAPFLNGWGAISIPILHGDLRICQIIITNHLFNICESFIPFCRNPEVIWWSWMPNERSFFFDSLNTVYLALISGIIFLLYIFQIIIDPLLNKILLG